MGSVSTVTGSCLYAICTPEGILRQQGASRELGWAPEVGFEEGMERTVRWYVEHEGWWRPLQEKAAIA